MMYIMARKAPQKLAQRAQQQYQIGRLKYHLSLLSGPQDLPDHQKDFEVM